MEKNTRKVTRDQLPWWKLTIIVSCFNWCNKTLTMYQKTVTSNSFTLALIDGFIDLLRRLPLGKFRMLLLWAKQKEIMKSHSCLVTFQSTMLVFCLGRLEPSISPTTSECHSSRAAVILGYLGLDNWLNPLPVKEETGRDKRGLEPLTWLLAKVFDWDQRWREADISASTWRPWLICATIPKLAVTSNVYAKSCHVLIGL